MSLGCALPTLVVATRVGAFGFDISTTETISKSGTAAKRYLPEVVTAYAG